MTEQNQTNNFCSEINIRSGFDQSGNFKITDEQLQKIWISLKSDNRVSKDINDMSIKQLKKWLSEGITPKVFNKVMKII